MEDHLDFHKIRVTDCEGRTLETTVHWDASAEDWALIFRAILYWLTFQPQTIDEFIPLEDEGIPENTN